MIWQNDGTARRIVVRKFELWVPQLHFTGKGQTMVNENFLKPTQWKYLQENLTQSSARKDANGRWLITPGVKTCFCIHSTKSETKFLYTKPLHF